MSCRHDILVVVLPKLDSLSKLLPTTLDPLLDAVRFTRLSLRPIPL